MSCVVNWLYINKIRSTEFVCYPSYFIVFLFFFKGCSANITSTIHVHFQLVMTSKSMCVFNKANWTSFPCQNRVLTADPTKVVGTWSTISYIHSDGLLVYQRFNSDFFILLRESQDTDSQAQPYKIALG